MAATVLLKDIVDTLEMQFDELPSFLNRDTGEIVTVSRDLLSEAEDSGEEDEVEPDLLDSRDDEWELAKQIVTSDRFLQLPTNFDVHEWSIMQEFADSAGQEKIRRQLLDAIHGAGAFRHFKSTVRRLNIEEDWFRFRTGALTEIAKEWCDTNQITLRGEERASGGRAG